MTIEAGRLGLNAMQGGATGVSNTLFPGGQPSAFNDALFHDHHLTAFAGDVGGESYNFVYADSRSDAYMCAVWSSNPDLAGGDCPYVTGRVDNTDHMPHLAMSAVLGRSIIDPMPNLRDEMNNPYNPAWVKDALDAYQTTIRNAYWLRRDTPALRTGRLLPTPPSDAARVTFSSRRLTSKSPLAWEHGVTTRRVERFPTGVFEDREQPGTTVLVVGNPYASPSHATVRFTFDGREYRELMNAEVVGAEASYSEDDDQLIVEVTVPSLDFATVEFHTGPEAEAL